MKKIIALFLVLIFSFPFTYSYNLSSVDTDLANRLAIEVQKKDTSEIEYIVENLKIVIKSWSYSPRINAILRIIVDKLDKNIDNNIEIEETISDTSDNIDYSLVKNNWLDWNNEVRKDLWLNPYTANPTLEESALIWSTKAKEKWEISHKRNPWDWFYDYNNINSWFKDQWVFCKNISSITHTENIWWGGYSCTDWECSDELSQATKRWFDAYMAEKWTKSDAHYRSLTQPYFTQIGVGVSIDEVKKNYFEYYLTIHYCTELIK